MQIDLEQNEVDIIFALIKTVNMSNTDEIINTVMGLRKKLQSISNEEVIENVDVVEEIKEKVKSK